MFQVEWEGVPPQWFLSLEHSLCFLPGKAGYSLLSFPKMRDFLGQKARQASFLDNHSFYQSKNIVFF